jgi:hypothetical protein
MAAEWRLTRDTEMGWMETVNRIQEAVTGVQDSWILTTLTGLVLAGVFAGIMAFGIVTANMRHRPVGMLHTHNLKVLHHVSPPGAGGTNLRVPDRAY